MKSKEFNGRGVVKTLPGGGKVHVAFGKITTQDDQELDALAIQIKDGEGALVTEFALLPESFGLMIEAIHDLFQGVQDEQPI